MSPAFLFCLKKGTNISISLFAIKFYKFDPSGSFLLEIIWHSNLPIYYYGDAY